MKDYTCVVDIPEVGNAGDVVSLDSELASTQELADAGKIRAVEVPAEQVGEASVTEGAAKPAEPHFSLIVNWRPGTTEGEQEAALSWIKESSAQLSASPEDLFPLCVDSFEVKRNR